MARRREPVRDFELCIRHASGWQVPASISVIVLDGPGPSDQALVHLVTPFERRTEVATTAAVEGRRRAPWAGSGATEPAEQEAEVPAPPIPQRNQVLALLTPRETEVLALLAEGKSTTAVADKLCISVATVRNHVKNTFKKLGVHSRLEAITLARRLANFGFGD